MGLSCTSSSQPTHCPGNGKRKSRVAVAERWRQLHTPPALRGPGDHQGARVGTGWASGPMVLILQGDCPYGPPTTLDYGVPPRGSALAVNRKPGQAG